MYEQQITSFLSNHRVNTQYFLRLRGFPALPLALPCFRSRTCSKTSKEYLQNVAENLDSRPFLFWITLRSRILAFLLFALEVFADQLLQGLLFLLCEQQSQVVLEICFILHQDGGLALVCDSHPPTRSDDIVQIAKSLQKDFLNASLPFWLARLATYVSSYLASKIS